jgi:hypothetical protein
MMFSCKKVARVLSSGELEGSGPWSRMSIKLHLMMCRHCTRFALQIRLIGNALRNFAPEEPPVGFESRLAGRLRAREDSSS